MKTAPSKQFESIREWQNPFFTLWPHRYDYLWAEHPHPEEPTNWKTESRHPLSDRLIQQGSYLYGVRFGQTTDYFLLDIDRGSAYHPKRDPFAWHRIRGALEQYGWVKSLAITSSYSGGLHLYFPFEDPQKTWEIALAVSTVLENAGFKLAPGQLEVFPNCKPYTANGEHSLYNGHRLPLQAGSYLLDEELQQLWDDPNTFVQHWKFAKYKNQVDKKALDRLIKAARRQQFRITGKANKFLNDLNAEVEQGWTGFGQTNRLLGRIAMRSYVFGHVLYADKALKGDDLVRDIVTIAKSLPGYEDWCRHQHEIERKAKEWMRAIEQSRYFHYGKIKITKGSKPDNSNDSKSIWNQHQQTSARERIQNAMEDLLRNSALPKGITKRFDALVTYRISGATLYRHRDLWHPRHLENNQNGDRQGGVGQDCLGGASCPTNPTNLLDASGCNPLLDKGLNDSDSEEQLENGCNSFSSKDLSNPKPKVMTREEGIARIKGLLKEIQANKQAEKDRRMRDLWENYPDPSYPQTD